MIRARTRAAPLSRVDQLPARRIELRAGELVRRHARDRGDLRDRPPLQLRHLRREPDLGGDLHEPPVEVAVHPRRHLAEPLIATRQELRSRPHVAGGDHPRHQRALARLRDAATAARARAATSPTAPPTPQQERARRRGHLVLGEMAGRDQIRAVGVDQRLDLRVASEPGHYAASPSVSVGSICASIASAARRYSPTSQSFAKMQIDPGRVDRRVPGLRLQRLKRHPLLPQPRQARVPEHVTRQPRNPGALPGAVDHLIKPGGRQRHPAPRALQHHEARVGRPPRAGAPTADTRRAPRRTGPRPARSAPDRPSPRRRTAAARPG